MKKLLFSLPFFLLLIVPQAKSQYFTFGTGFKCAADSTLEDSYTDAKKQIAATLADLQANGKLYSYDVDYHKDKFDDAPDSTHFMVMMYALEETEFKATTTTWEEENPGILKFLTGICPSRSDEKFGESTSFLPVIRHPYAAVSNIEHVDIKPDPNLKYNIVIDFTSFVKPEGVEGHTHDIDPKSLNFGLAEIGRLLNLHVGAGIPQENINIVVAVHGMASESFLNNEAYLEEHKIENPNISLLEELNDADVKFLMCGQSLGDTKKSELLPFANITFTAQTTLSEYQSKGYALKVIKNND
ncbi:DsrE family protein [Algoriphagus sp. SE2]|uniref:DsrE family protein n=1 Tax=Algoriphagus sp. SE2 TaxID=3141536 RepID=UPI0031CD9E98